MKFRQSKEHPSNPVYRYQTWQTTLEQFFERRRHTLPYIKQVSRLFQPSFGLDKTYKTEGGQNLPVFTCSIHF